MKCGVSDPAFMEQDCTFTRFLLNAQIDRAVK